MCGHSVMVEQREQEEAEHAPLWGPCVEDQRSGGIVSTFTTWRRPVRKSRTLLNDELEGCAVANEQHSYVGVPLIQME